MVSRRNSIAKLLGILVPGSVSDFEMVSRLQKLIDAHHDFTVVSRRYDDPALLRAASRSPPPSRSRTRTPDRSAVFLNNFLITYTFVLQCLP